MRRGGGPRGVALINALVLVAGLSAIAVGLMLRSDAARQRLAGMTEAGQAAAYLDAAQLLGQQLLTQAPGAEAATHTGQGWAQGYRDEPIDQGVVSLQISDLQGRFNLAWLGTEFDEDSDALLRELAREAFGQLTQDIGLSATTRRRLMQALDPDLGQRVTAWGRATRPPPLPLTDIAQLRLIEGLSDADITALAPYVAALPEEQMMNLNTVRPEVLAAFLPGVSAANMARMLEAARPFTDLGQALDWFEDSVGEAAFDRVELFGLSITSGWFELQLDARLDTLRLRRKVIVRRANPAACCTVVLSMPESE